MLVGFVVVVLLWARKCVVMTLSLHSRYTGIVSRTRDSMLGGAVTVVIMKVLMTMQGCVRSSRLIEIMLSSIRTIIVIGILKYRLKIRNSISMKLRQWSTLATTVMFLGATLARNVNSSGSMMKQVKV